MNGNSSPTAATPIRVLLILSSNSDAVLVKANLRCSEERAFDVQHVRTQQAGIEALAGGGIDIIVLDWNLPDSVGIATLRGLKEFAFDIPIVVLSELDGEAEAIEAVRIGAQDCLEKSEAITKPLGKVLEHSIERFHRQHAQRDIASAELVQRRLFPAPLPPIAGYDVCGRCDPANLVGGDYYDYFLVEDSHLIVVIGDVSGHGFGPSLVMAETRAALRTMAATSNDIGTMIHQVNNLIHVDDIHWFVTLFLGKIDTKTGRCHYASAGQPAILKRADGSISELSSRDLPLGIERDFMFSVSETTLATGDTLLLYTDGISERLGGPSEYFGVDRITQQLIHSDGRSAAETVATLFTAANEFAAFRPSTDDMTAVVIKVTAAVGSS
jgi:serine phosphatase RsbU (regulator of sigma subunit)